MSHTDRFSTMHPGRCSRCNRRTCSSVSRPVASQMAGAGPTCHARDWARRCRTRALPASCAMPQQARAACGSESQPLWRRLHGLPHAGHQLSAADAPFRWSGMITMPDGRDHTVQSQTMLCTQWSPRTPAYASATPNTQHAELPGLTRISLLQGTTAFPNCVLRSPGRRAR